MNFSKIYILSIVLFFITSCGSLERTFVDQMNRESDGLLVPGKDFPVMGGDTGDAYRSEEEIQLRTPASARSQSRSKNLASLKQELAIKEEALKSEEEVDQYRSDQRYLPSISDKLYYLSLAGEERTQYIKTKREDNQVDKNGTQDLVENHSVHSGELYLGMGKDEVVKLWGKPMKVDIAGNPKNQNERWSFAEDGNTKQVYFEEGKVQGWALDL